MPRTCGDAYTLKLLATNCDEAIFSCVCAPAAYREQRIDIMLQLY